VPDRTGQRLLLVHAHPDDETINNGATVARYRAEGTAVALVTCTLGEMGEILVPELAGLAAERGDQLGGYRMWELDRALAALDVTDHRYLGGPGRWRDSGMMGTQANADPRAFWQLGADPAAFEEAVQALVDVVGSVRPQVVVSYDPDGGYGHPDHIMAHRVAMAAVAAASDIWSVAKVYWTVSGHAAGATSVDASSHLDAKRAAMRAHATQITVAGEVFALSNKIEHRLTGVERYRLVQGQPGELDNDGQETDLFAGVAAS
jgi:N-acetyl-1-D-myo-inositol-2-amino-2-deoxy-alpha-D-glucopyranoside deacetylase